MRKNNPELKRVVDDFLTSHAAGTSFGNTLLRRYLQDTKWVRNSTSGEEMKKYEAIVAFFQKYAAEYNFDYLMLAAQGYQESLLDQSRRSRSGAIGIMQVIPKYAAASPINVPNVRTAEGNIHAGAKMLRNIADTYFNAPGSILQMRPLFVFVCQQAAGPTRIAQAEARQRMCSSIFFIVWFRKRGVVLWREDIGQETVIYVGNIYKYYVAYKLAVEQAQLREKAKAAAAR